jgi:hypothetical protein
MTMLPMDDGSNPDLALPALASLIAAIRSRFPQAQITSGYRGPNNPLTMAHPHSMHAQGSPSDPRAVDVAPIPGVAFGDYVSALKNAGVQVGQAFDEAKHPFPWTTGPNWHVAEASSGTRTPTMPLGPSRYPAPYYGGADPLAPLPGPNTPEQPTMPTPVDGSAAPSVSVAATAPAAVKKRHGILGALESVFMPDPDSRWAAALRGGLFDAKANQQLYKQQEAKNQLDVMMQTAKLKTFLTKGEYQIVGNNVFHTGPDGRTEWLSPPATDSEHERLLTKWQSMSDSDPAKKLIETMLLGGNTPDVLATKAATSEKTARIRAGATTGAATIRANTVGKTNVLPPLPPGAKVIH